MARRSLRQVVMDTVRGTAYGLTGGLTSGGVVHHGSGAGTAADKTEAAFFRPTRIWSRQALQILCIESFAARLAVEIIPEDMFLQRRRFKDMTEAKIKDFEKALKRHRVDDRVRTAMIAGRQYGTGLLVIISKEAPLTEPLEPKRIREGDLLALRVFNRFDASVFWRNQDIMSSDEGVTYGDPIFYDLHPNYGGVPVRVHGSRVIRFNGLTDPGDSGLSHYYHQDWGVSMLVPIITSIMQEALGAQASAHMIQEASIPVLRIDNLRNIIAGGPGTKHQASAEEIGEGVNRYKSVFHTLMLDRETEEFDRVAIAFGGVANILDRAARRVAAAARVPMTRFWGTSPVGMNATGKGDMDNYIITFEAKRKNELQSVYEMLDEVVARSNGMQGPPEYEWPSLLDMSEKDRAEVAKSKGEAVKGQIEAGTIDEDEGRGIIDGDSIFGPLPGQAPELPEPAVLPPPVPGETEPGFDDPPPAPAPAKTAPKKAPAKQPAKK